MGEETNMPAKKCQKCARSTWRARHDDFCEQCSAEDIQPASLLNKNADRLKKKCRRCVRPQFAARHQEFCDSETCEGLIIISTTTLTTEPTPTPEPEHRPIEEGDLKKKVKKNKKKKEKKKGKKKEKKNKKQGIEVDDSVSDTPLAKPEKDLGPLENLIKYLIQTNTFTHR